MCVHQVCMMCVREYQRVRTPENGTCIIYHHTIQSIKSTAAGNTSTKHIQNQPPLQHTTAFTKHRHSHKPPNTYKTNPHFNTPNPHIIGGAGGHQTHTTPRPTTQSN